MFVCSVVHTLAAHSSACAVGGEVCVSEQTVCDDGLTVSVFMWKRSLVLGLAVVVPVVVVAVSSPRLSIADSPAVLAMDPGTFLRCAARRRPAVSRCREGAPRASGHGSGHGDGSPGCARVLPAGATGSDTQGPNRSIRLQHVAARGRSLEKAAVRRVTSRHCSPNPMERPQGGGDSHRRLPGESITG